MYWYDYPLLKKELSFLDNKVKFYKEISVYILNIQYYKKWKC